MSAPYKRWISRSYREMPHTRGATPVPYWQEVEVIPGAFYSVELVGRSGDVVKRSYLVGSRKRAMRRGGHMLLDYYDGWYSDDTIDTSP